MTWCINPDVVWVESDDEVRLYNPAGGTFETLNSSGAAVWLLVAKGTNLASMVDELSRSWGAGDVAQRARIRSDVTRFVDDLVARDLLHPGSSADAASG